jgi:hypothetical protein
MVWAKPRGGQIAAIRAAASMVTARQRDAGGLAAGSGENGAHFVLGAINKHCEQQVGVKPRSGEPFVFGGQAVDMHDRLQPLECEFDLPAQSIQRADAIDRKYGRRERGEKDEVLGPGERARVGARTLIFATCLLSRGPCARARFWRLLDQNEPHGDRPERAARLAHLDRHVHRAFRRGFLEHRQPIERLSLRVGEVQTVPGQSHKNVGAGLEHIAQSAGLREAAVGEAYLAWLHTKPIEPIAMLQRGDLRLDQPASMRIIGKV